MGMYSMYRQVCVGVSIDVQAGLCGCVRGGTGRSVWVCPWAYRQVCVGVSIDVQAGLCVGVSMDVQAGLCGCVH